MGRSVRTVTATVGATNAPLEMIRCGENHAPVFIEIEIGLVGKANADGNDSPHFGQNGGDAVELAGNPRHRFQAGAAKARRFEVVGHQAF